MVVFAKSQQSSEQPTGETALKDQLEHIWHPIALLKFIVENERYLDGDPRHRDMREAILGVVRRILQGNDAEIWLRETKNSAIKDIIRE